MRPLEKSKLKEQMKQEHNEYDAPKTELERGGDTSCLILGMNTLRKEK